MNKEIKRPEGVAAAPGQIQKASRSIFIPARSIISYAGITDTDLHFRLEIMGGAQRSSKQFLSAEDVYSCLRKINYLTIELLHD